MMMGREMRPFFVTKIFGDRAQAEVTALNVYNGSVLVKHPEKLGLKS
ncbi:hypothetical protein NIES2135_24870 [Leptolyngbya boryana NIES-2135]|uniref:Uncharacterized protein n=1 Tax=Leptolyngbya boryana NIES-2135 TaxID=1973484 RepID=A0A1Z4JG83_LEPBY|nr:hypothetical protein NIES2135_24870 [Leptolyngbya boryana NIES-2135]